MATFTSTIANGLKLTISKIVTDERLAFDKGAVYKRIFDEESMSDYYEDDLEVGGPGLASEKTEGANMAVGDIQEGALTRYIARTFALKLIISEEAMEDSKYPKIIMAAKRLARAMHKTVEYDAANVFARAFNSVYTGGDGQPLVSTAHTLPGGGTFSNQMATPMAASRAALLQLRVQAKKMPGHDGLVSGQRIKRIICPVDQINTWEGVIGSSKVPESNANEINIVNTSMKPELVDVEYWDNTTTQYLVQTDCDNGLKFKWRRKLRNKNWVDNDQELVNHAQSGRWTRGWSDPRCVIGVNA